MANGQGSMILQMVRSAPPRRGPGDVRPIFVREWQRCMRPAFVAGAMVLAVALGIGMQLPPTPFLVLSVGGMIASGLTFVGLARWLARSRLNPAYRVAAATTVALAGRWRAFDGGGIPRDGDEGLARVGDQTGDTATALRIWCLMCDDDRLDEARSVLRAWAPEEPRAVAYRLRCAAMLGGEPAIPATPEDIERAISAIDDPDAVRLNRLSYALEQAVRRDAAGEDPFPPILAVDPLVGDIDVRRVMRDRG